jgi:hypothetical protein
VDLGAIVRDRIDRGGRDHGRQRQHRDRGRTTVSSALNTESTSEHGQIENRLLRDWMK